MASAKLKIDLAAISENWKTLDSLSSSDVNTGAVLKANGYGLGAVEIATALLKHGVNTFFVALAEEGAVLRRFMSDSANIFVLSGHMPGDAKLLHEFNLIPTLNSAAQYHLHKENCPSRPFAIQLDTGMNRLGMEPAEFISLRNSGLSSELCLVMSHLACGDEPEHPLNQQQLDTFLKITDGLSTLRSLAATAGILLGPDYHFDLVRPGIGLYGCAPFTEGRPAIQLELPVIQIRLVNRGEAVGYNAAWVADRQCMVATVSVGYADGIHRIAGKRAALFHDGIRCPIIGRISMDLITADISALSTPPSSLQLICEQQTVDDLAESALTIGHEVLTSLGTRYQREFIGLRGGSD